MERMFRETVRLNYGSCSALVLEMSIAMAIEIHKIRKPQHRTTLIPKAMAVHQRYSSDGELQR